MKNNYLFFFVFMSSSLAGAQVIVAPTILFMSDHSPYGTFIVMNKSTVPQEISISFKFGFPESDSLGNVIMQYDDSSMASRYSCQNWVRGFPQKFILNPEQQQVVRLLIVPSPGIQDGEYWTRLITSSTPQAKLVDTMKAGITANITFVLQQVTTIIYRKGNVNTTVDFSGVRANPDSESVDLIAHLVRGGNAPFLGTISVSVHNQADSAVYSDQQVIAVYRDEMSIRFDVPLSKLVVGRYTAEFVIQSQRTDVPEEDLLEVTPVKQTVSFSVQ